MKPLWRYAIACFPFFLFVAFNSYAQEAWTLRKCVDYAMLNNPELQAAENKINSSRYDLDFQKSLFFPRLDFHSITGYLTGEPISPWAVVRGVTDEQVVARNASGDYLIGFLGLNIPVVKEGVFLARNAPSINMATQQVSIDRNTYETKKNEIIFAVSTSYLNLVKNQEDVKIAEEHVKSLKAYQNLIQSKYKEGLISKNELLKVVVKVGESEKDAKVYQNSSYLLAADLSIKMGLERPKSIVTSDEGFVPPVLSPVEEFIHDALSSRAEIAAQQLRVSRAKEDLRRAQNQRYPNVEIASNVGVGNDYGSRTNSLWSAELRASIPIFDFGGVGSKIKSRQEKVAEEQKVLLSLSGSITQEVVTAYTNIANAKPDIELKEKMVEQSTENAKLFRARFEQNLAPLSSLLEAEYVLHNDHKALAEAKYNLRAGYLQLIKAVDYRRLSF
jgi:outer membrane protein